MSQDSFIFYRSFYESLQILPKNDRLLVYEAIIRLALFEEISEFDGTKGALWTLIKPQVMANIEKRKNGKRGGRPRSGQKEPEKTETTGYEKEKTTGSSEKKPNVNVNVNVNGNVNAQVSYDADFEVWWKLYPSKIDKKKAYASWKKNVSVGELQMILNCTQKYIEDCERADRSFRHPTTWLNNDWKQWAEIKTEDKPKKVTQAYLNRGGQGKVVL